MWLRTLQWSSQVWLKLDFVELESHPGHCNFNLNMNVYTSKMQNKLPISFIHHETHEMLIELIQVT